MIEIPATINTYQFDEIEVRLYVPSTEWIQSQYKIEQSILNNPYWAQVWPAAKALCEVIATEPLLIQNKNVMEIAAGLGLPSLLAAQYAKSVWASDIEAEAVKLMKRSAASNQLQNFRCSVLDWSNINNITAPDVLLLSDINYDANSFELLYSMIKNYIEKGSLIILSTPQRLVAKSFMERLQPWCVKTYTIPVPHNGESVFTSVWLLSATQKGFLSKDKSKPKT